jgi:hypothetical protein
VPRRHATGPARTSTHAQCKTLDDGIEEGGADERVSDAGREVHTLESQLAEFERFAVLADDMRADIRVIAVRIEGRREAREVVVFFRQEDFPDVLFGYRCMPPSADRYERVWLGEALATGELHLLMRSGNAAPDADGVVWIRLRGSTLVSTQVANA